MISRKRSLLKAITWRLGGSVVTAGVVFGFTGDGGMSVGAGVADIVIKFIAYYIHERLWARVDWGRMDIEDKKNKVSGTEKSI